MELRALSNVQLYQHLQGLPRGETPRQQHGRGGGEPWYTFSVVNNHVSNTSENRVLETKEGPTCGSSAGAVAMFVSGAPRPRGMGSASHLCCSSTAAVGLSRGSLCQQYIKVWMPFHAAPCVDSEVYI